MILQAGYLLSPQQSSLFIRDDEAGTVKLHSRRRNANISFQRRGRCNVGADPKIRVDTSPFVGERDDAVIRLVAPGSFLFHDGKAAAAGAVCDNRHPNANSSSVF